MTALFLAVALVLFGTNAVAGEVYVSFGADGVPRYATQPLDASYRLLPGTSAAAELQLPPSKRPAVSTQHLPIIRSVAQRHGLPAGLIAAVSAVESGHDPRAVSPKGARGLMQLMPATGAQYGLATREQLHDPERNLDAGARHLKHLLARHHGSLPLALAAYNSGSGAVIRAGERIPSYQETMLYVPAVLMRMESSRLP